MKATIHEMGNGFPSVGSYVSGDGTLYEVTAILGRIQTHEAGRANTLSVDVEEADYADCDADDEFQARADVEKTLDQLDADAATAA
jgi:hypothetical protein